MKKIGIFINDFSEGGVEFVLINLANQLETSKYSVSLICLNNRGPLIKKVKPHVKIINLSSSSLSSGIPKLYHFLKENKLDLFITGKTYINIVSVILCKVFLKQKLLITEHTVLSLNSKYANGFKMKYIIPFLARLFLKRADMVISVSKGVEKDLIENYNVKSSKVSTIYNPVITQEFSERLNDEVVDFHFTNNKKYIISVGRLVYSKRIDLLIDAFLLVKQSMNDVHLIIIGDGSELENLKKQVSDYGIDESVSFLGFKENPLPYIKQSDVFVLTSDYEGFGNVLVEALYCETPVISSNCLSGPSEILEDGKYGILINHQNPKEYSEQIIKILSEEQMLDASYKNRAYDFYDSKIIGQYEEIIDKLIRKRGC